MLDRCNKYKGNFYKPPLRFEFVANKWLRLVYLLKRTPTFLLRLVAVRVVGGIVDISQYYQKFYKSWCFKHSNLSFQLLRFDTNKYSNLQKEFWFQNCLKSSFNFYNNAQLLSYSSSFKLSIQLNMLTMFYSQSSILWSYFTCSFCKDRPCHPWYNAVSFTGKPQAWTCMSKRIRGQLVENSLSFFFSFLGSSKRLWFGYMVYVKLDLQ